MIVDAHIHMSDRPTGVWKHPPFTAEQVIEMMDGPFILKGRSRRVDWAVVQPHPAETTYEPDFRAQHRYVIEAVTRYPKRLVGCMTINPHLGVEKGLKVLKELVASYDFRAVKLHPTSHVYMPPRCMEMLLPILTVAGELNIPVIIHTGDTPFALPVLMAPLAEARPETKIILAHMGTQKVCYADEAIYIAGRYDNVFLETGWAPLPRVKEAYAALGPEKLLLASDCPIQETGSQMRVLEALTFQPPIGMGISEVHLEKMLGDNAGHLFHLGQNPRSAAQGV